MCLICTLYAITSTKMRKLLPMKVLRPKVWTYQEIIRYMCEAKNTAICHECSHLRPPLATPKWLEPDNHSTVTKINRSTPILNHQGYVRTPYPRPWELKSRENKCFRMFLSLFIWPCWGLPLSFFPMIECYWLRLGLVTNLDVKEKKVSKSSVFFHPSIMQWWWDMSPGLM